MGQLIRLVIKMLTNIICARKIGIVIFCLLFTFYPLYALRVMNESENSYWVNLPSPPLNPEILGYPTNELKNVKAAPVPISGPQKTIVILISFYDKLQTKTKDYVNELVFTTMNDYYLEASYDQISFVGNITSNWHLMPRNMTYYGEDTGVTRRDLVNDAVHAVDSEVDYRSFDRAIIVHAGHDEASSWNSDDIWSFAYLGARPFLTGDGFVSLGVATVSEFDPMGVFAHEIGHTLGPTGLV